MKLICPFVRLNTTLAFLALVALSLSYHETLLEAYSLVPSGGICGRDVDTDDDYDRENHFAIDVSSSLEA